MKQQVGIRSFFAAALLIAGCTAATFAQAAANRILEPIDEARSVTLAGNVHPMAKAEFDQGPVSLETPLKEMMLELEPSSAQQAELDALVEAQHDPDSPLYRQWLTPAEYGARFGASAADVAKIAAWLEGHGFTVEEIPAGNRLIVFSGTAGQVLDTFHTEIHRYLANGATHIANVQDPQIPEALAGVVDGIVSLHDFRRNSEIASRRALSAKESGRSALGARPEYSSGSTHYIFPGDWATIYDLNSLYSGGTKGSGSSIAIVGRSDINMSDVTAFRSASGLVANNPTFLYVSADPGLVAGDQDESTLDVEWSGAVAPMAAVKFVIGASTATADGVDLSAQYIVNHATAQVVSTSYGSCELDMGSSGAAFYNALWEQAASEGMSAFISSGDSGAAGCYAGGDSTGSGTGVNGLCSSPYSTCVGGTEFNEVSNSSEYWSGTNSSSYESALSYIPEEVWNESGSNGGSGLWASGGGASIYYQQPSWQKGVSGTAAANGMRAVPDVAMTASGHDGYIIYEDGGFWVIAGTSAASPTFAGVMALVVESQGGKGQGNANTTLYPLLNANRNPFHATPSGNNSVPGVTGFTASGAPYNLSTGLGSVDGAVLVSSWPGSGTVSSTDFTLTPSATSGTASAGKSTAFTLSVTESGTAKNAVALTASAPTGVTVGFSATSISPGSTSTVTVTAASSVAAGAQTVTITGKDATGTRTATYTLTVTAPPTLKLSAASSTVAVAQGASNTVALTAAAGGSFSGSITFTATGLPAGVTAGWSSNPISSASASNSETVTLTASASAAVANSTVTITAAGDGLTASQTVTLQVQTAAGVKLTAAPTSVSVVSNSSAQVTFTATPTGSVAIPAAASGSSISVTSGVPAGFTATWSAPALTSAGAAVWTLTLTGGANASAGSSTLAISAKIVAKSGTSYTATQSVPIAVTAVPPTLTMTPASTALSVTQGATVTDSIALAGNSTFKGAVSLGVTGLPSGVTANWSSGSVTLSGESGAATLSLTASSTAAVGSSTLTVTASGDGLTATKQIALQVQQAPAIQLTASPTSVSMVATSTSTVTVTATPVGGVTVPTGATGATISVASGLPKGVTATFGAPTVNTGGAVVWTLTLAGSSTAAVGSATLSLSAKVVAKTGTSYSATQNLPLTVTAPAPTLAVSAASTSVSLAKGATATDLISLSGNSTYSGAVTLSVTGLPSGVTASWSANPVTLTAESGSSKLTLTASSAASAGAATVTVKASGDNVTASQNMTVTVSAAAPTLTMTPAAATMTVINPIEATSAAQSVASQVFTFAGGGSFTGSVSLSVSGLPANLTAKWSSNPVTLSSANAGTSTLTITAGETASGAALTTVTPGAYTLTVTAVGDGLTVTKTIVVDVQGMTATPSATTLTVARGGKGSFSIATTMLGGASGVVEPGLAANASPNGITVTATPTSLSAPGSGTITFQFTVSATAALATYQLLPSAALLTSATATTPTLIGMSTAPVTLAIVQ
jgi:subtilase family serine protease